AGRLRGDLHIDDRIQTHQGPPAFMATSTVAIPSTTSETEDARAKRTSIWRRSINASSCKNVRSWIGVASMNANPTSRRLSSTEDRKSTRLNSSHVKISYAVFCLKKKKTD